MKKKVFFGILFSSLLTLALTLSLVVAALYNDFSGDHKKSVRALAAYIKKAVEKSGVEYLKETGVPGENRITLISSDGKVLFDNYKDVKTLESQSSYPEIIKAGATGKGEATRKSDLTGKQIYYYAQRLENGDILRVSVVTTSIFGVISNTVLITILIVLLALLLSVLAAGIFTKSIVAPINRLNLDNPLSNDTYGELTPLLSRMEKQNKKINLQFKELQAKQLEFNTITENMNEALVLFSEAKTVLYGNKSARQLFNFFNNNAGYLELCRDIEYIGCAKEAFLGTASSCKIEKNGRTYELSFNPVKGEKAYAAILFGVDITEKEQREIMRREFSANVSHELKTPLTSIMGYAEILVNGIAKKEDFPRFAQNIYLESKRLLSLIEDIIKLSHLDEENIKAEFRDIDLQRVSDKVLSELSDKADKNEVSLTLTGEVGIISGIEEIVHEMIYNLCDNAISYNKKGGSVSIRISNENSRVILSVKDTGIGIAPEHQTRIFERFYRADKSRFKKTGGTGLGLSIVKHGALLHKAEIELSSRVDVGTEIKLIFNKA